MVRGSYMRNAPIRRLRHPLEESPVWGVLGGALAGILALVVGLPVLLVVCTLIPFCLLGRWLLLFIFWNRQTSATTQGGGPESVRGNDGRWLGSAWRYSVIHAVLIFEAGAGLDVTQLRNLLLTRVVPLYPRLTRRPVPLPLSAGAGHCWLPDSQFSIDRHVFAGPSVLTTEKQLQDYVGHLLGEGLSNDKPPWELHVLQSIGRHQDTVAILRVHQSVADGMALVRVLCHSLADCQVLHVPQRPHFGALAFTLNMFRACLVGPLTLLFWLLLTTEDCNVLTQRKGWTGQVSVTWSAAITLPKVTRIKQVTRSTVNCVLLSALAGSARRLLQGCGIKQPPDMKIVLPVDLRTDVTSSRLSSHLGSKMAPVVVGLPVGVEGAVPRLWAMRRNLDSLRTSADPVVVYVATAALMATVPGQVARRALAALTGKATLQFSSLPGPTSTLLVGGHPLKGVYPLLPAQNSLGLAVSVFTYADQVYVAIISDSTLSPAASTLLHHLHCQIELLWQLLLHRRVPGEARSHVLLRRTDVTGSPVRELRLRLTCVQEEVQRLATFQSPSQQHKSQSSESSASEQQEAARLQNLKTEFSELLSELRRRNSAAVAGSNSPVFEDEEVGGELWRPRRRAMSCSSSRRSSRSLVGLLTSARPASFIESYSTKSPTSPSSPIICRPATSERTYPGSARPASYVDPHSTASQASPLACRAAASECVLPGAIGPISPEEFYSSSSKGSPVSPIKHVPATVGYLVQHSTFCATNITVISEHPSEVRNPEESENNIQLSPTSTTENLNSLNTINKSAVYQNKCLDMGNHENNLEAENNECSRDTEIQLYNVNGSSLSPSLHSDLNNVNIDTAYATINSQSVVQSSNNYSETDQNILNNDISYTTGDLRDHNAHTTTRSKTIFKSPVSITQIKDFSLPPSECSVTQLREGTATHHTQPDVKHSTSLICAKDVQKQKRKINSGNVPYQEESCNEFSAVAIVPVNQEFSSQDLLKEIKEREGEIKIPSYSNNSSVTGSISEIIAHNFPLNKDVISQNIFHQESCSGGTTSGQTVINSNTRKATGTNYKTHKDLHDVCTPCDQKDTKDSYQQGVTHSFPVITTNLASVSNSNLHSEKTTKFGEETGEPQVTDSDIQNREECVINLTRNYSSDMPRGSLDFGADESDPVIVQMDKSCSHLTTQIEPMHSIIIPDLVCSPSNSATSSVATGEQSIGYCIMESTDSSPTVSIISPNSCSSTSVTSVSSDKTLNSSSTFPPSTPDSPEHIIMS